MPDGAVFITFCILLRCVDAVSGTAMEVSYYMVLINEFPENLATVMVWKFYLSGLSCSKAGYFNPGLSKHSWNQEPRSFFFRKKLTILLEYCFDFQRENLVNATITAQILPRKVGNKNMN